MCLCVCGWSPSGTKECVLSIDGVLAIFHTTENSHIDINKTKTFCVAMTDRLELQSVREREVKCGQFVILLVE